MSTKPINFRPGLRVVGTTQRGGDIAGKVIAVHERSNGAFIELMTKDKRLVNVRPSGLRRA